MRAMAKKIALHGKKKIMETLFSAAIFIVGILVMFRVITVRKSGKYLIWIALIFVFGPVLYHKNKIPQFFIGKSSVVGVYYCFFYRSYSFKDEPLAEIHETTLRTLYIA